MTLGELIKQKREKVDLTQTELAEKLGTSQGRVSMIEHDKASTTEDEDRLLRELLDIDVAEYLDVLMDACSQAERSLINDDRLSARDKELVLMVYGKLTGRDSLANTLIYRTKRGASSE